MVNINSYTYNPEGVDQLAKLTAHHFAQLDFTPEFVTPINNKFGNHLFLRHPDIKSLKETSKPTICLISHLDTVFSSKEESENNFSWRIDGDRIYGPGTVDIKGGTVMIYMVLDTIKHFYPDIYDAVNWIICLDSCEEALSHEFSEQCLDRLQPNTLACLVFEGGTVSDDAYSIVTSRKGRATFRVEAYGRSAHSGNAHQNGANAIVQLSKTIQKIAELTDYHKELTFNVGVIQGGSVVNRVPHYATAEVEMRTFEKSVFDNAMISVMALSGTSDVTSQDGFPCTISVQLLDQMSPWPSNDLTLSLFNIWRSVGEENGMKIIEEARGGLSDGNPLSKHYPTLDGLGPIGANAHCSEQAIDGSKQQEYVLKSSFIGKAFLNTQSIVKLISWVF